MKLLKYMAVAISAPVAAMTLSTFAHAGWFAGSCQEHFDNGGCGVCVEHNSGTDAAPVWWHVNGPDGSHSDPVWNGYIPGSPSAQPYGTYEPNPGNPFTFYGVTALSCLGESVTANCGLTLEGLVKKEDDTVGIQVVGGDVSGSDLLCGYVDLGFDYLSNHQWWAGDNSQHSGFGPSSSITITNQPYIGAIGNISFRVRNPIFFPPYLVQVSNAHIHDVVFTNSHPVTPSDSRSCFSFEQSVLNSDESPTGCRIDGTLCTQGNDVNIHTKAC